MKVTRQIINRLAEIVNNSGLTKSGFSRKLGFSDHRLSEILNKHNENLSGNFLNGLEYHFHVNLKWLETGFGDHYIYKDLPPDNPKNIFLNTFDELTPRYRDRIMDDLMLYKELSEKEKSALRVAENQPRYGSKRPPKNE